MTKCELLKIEMPIGKQCPSIYSDKEDICYSGCGFAEELNIINLVGNEITVQPVRDISFDVARKQIIKFCQEKKLTTISEIVEILPIDLKTISIIVQELQKEGLIKSYD